MWRKFIIIIGVYRWCYISFNTVFSRLESLPVVSVDDCVLLFLVSLFEYSVFVTCFFLFIFAVNMWHYCIILSPFLCLIYSLLFVNVRICCLIWRINVFIYYTFAVVFVVILRRCFQVTVLSTVAPTPIRTLTSGIIHPIATALCSFTRMPPVFLPVICCSTLKGVSCASDI